MSHGERAVSLGAAQRFDEQPDRMMIEAHLACVIQSSRFADTVRLQRFLIHIVTETLKGACPGSAVEGGPWDAQHVQRASLVVAP